MLYVSEVLGRQYGITDTDDNVTEYLSDKQLYEVSQKLGFGVIKGARFSGSRFICRVTNPLIEQISELPNGVVFQLKISSDSVFISYKKIGELGDASGWQLEQVDDSSKNVVLKKSYLLKNKNGVEVKL
jgi:hypothetical protein